MANKSDWKGFEKLVGATLGGQRRFRTTEDYGKVADDIRFSRKMRRRHPILKSVAVECKKRRTLNVHAMFAEAKSKYGEGEKHIILASKVPRHGSYKKLKVDMEIQSEKSYARLVKKVKGHRARKALARRLEASLQERLKRLKMRRDISALVTVELEFFKELWEAWLIQHDNGGGVDD